MAKTQPVAVASLETRIATVIATEFAVVASTADAKAAAFALLTGISTKEALDPVRDAVKAAYTTRYLVDIGTDAEKAKNAANMFWSRTVARAVERGFVKPVSETPEAQKAREKREASGKGKPDGRSTKAKKTGAKEAKANGVIVPETDDDVLQEALDFAMEHQAQFIVWFMREQRATHVARAA